MRCCLLLFVSCCASVVLADVPLKIEVDRLGDFQYPLVPGDKPAAIERIELQTPIPPVLGWQIDAEKEKLAALLTFNPQATTATFELSAPVVAKDKATLAVWSAEKSQQLPDGRILFSASDATVKGKTAKLESHPGNDRIGFWNSLDDVVRWDFTATRPGTYQVWLTYSKANDNDAIIEIQYGPATLTAPLPATGSWYRYRCANLGNIELLEHGPAPLSVKGLEMTGGALMNLKAVTLIPTSEGEPVVQADDGEILCHARDVTIHGVRARWESNPKKITVGYWAVPEDKAVWDFEVSQPGTFDVEVLQGCGKGHGGSDVDVFVNDQKLTFAVEDTGHFQNFVPRVIGRVSIEKTGTSRLVIAPLNKTSVAVMDVRQVRLVPVKE